MSKEATARSAMKLALGKIKSARDCHPNAVNTLLFEAEEILEESLEKPDFWEGYVPEPVKPRGEATLAQQEPVAWGIVASNTGRICQVELDADEVEGHNPKHIVPLYTSPPAQRTWVNATTWRGLTDEELSEVYNQADWDTVSDWEYERAIEAKLKEKNT